MISELLILLAAATLILSFILKPNRKWDASIKGPKGLPFIGNVLQIDKLQHITYSKWAEEFGPIFRLDLLTTKSIVISDHVWLKELFSEHSFSGRMDTHLFDFVKQQRGLLHGVITNENEHWEELRRFTLRNLRDFGFGKTSMEDSIMIEVNEMIEGLKGTEEKPLENVKGRLILAVVNSLWNIATGKRFKQNDEALLKLTEDSLITFNKILENGGILFFVPWVGKYFPKLSGYSEIRRFMDKFSSNFKLPVVEHLNTFDENHMRDFIDVFIKEIKRTKNPDSAFYGTLGEENLQAVLIDFHNAGTDTSSATLAWLILYLSKLQDIQRKFHEEITTITGNTRQCSLTDRQNMPYTEALISEVLRFSSITPLGVQHRAIKDYEFRGYTIPKDTMIIPNLYYIHHDPKVWGDPEHFRPERFLSPDGKTFKKHDALIPFSVGRRQCLGETLARDSLFLFATNIFQKFSVEFDKNGPDNGYEAIFGFVMSPKPYNIILNDRLA